jgi:hypothetical protein
MSFESIPGEAAFVVAQIGSQRIALPGETVSELIAAPAVHTFPHTTPLISGVVVRRGQILPVIDLGPGVIGQPTAIHRFFLVVNRRMGTQSDRCAIPVHGECELVSGILFPAETAEGCALGFLDLNGERVDVLDLERAILAGAAPANSAPPGATL